MIRYFNVFERDKPDFTTRIWVEEEFCGDIKFQGYSTETKKLEIGWKSISQMKKKKKTPSTQENSNEKEILIQKEGPGRLYYRMGMTYAPESLTIDSIANGFEISRSYSSVEKDCIIFKDSDQVWNFPKGQLVKVTLLIKTQYTRYNVAIVDKMVMCCFKRIFQLIVAQPAGFEAENFKLKTNTSSEQVQTGTLVFDHVKT